MKIATIVKSHESTAEYLVEVRNRKGDHITSMIFQGTNKYADMVAALKLMGIKTIEPVGISAVEIAQDMIADGFYAI